VRRHASAGTIAEPDVGRRHDLRTEGVDDGKSQSPECEDPLELSHIDLAAPVLEPGVRVWSTPNTSASPR